ncbi:MAG TPA: glycosyltransferase family 39 protein [Aggregatilinea sp.]|uniref:ArnT family glycosyltransferase n=1 Tax=Aggregatilinea sp. TaxID=2806333 RepID=UPI002B9A701E|nr:glycosyltransferase family 39 protein [Aggregatilinea sp.]HML20406.1 glycosyltransferase family 39 protein [Aggregatilinea sp.]
MATYTSPSTDSSYASRAALWIGRILLAAAALLLIAHTLIYIHYAIGLMRFPFDYDQGEGFELVDTVMFSHGDWPYRSNEVYPFYASNYPPLFHLILVPFVWVFGPAYWYGRLMGFLGTLITASAIGYAVHREGRHRLIAIFSALAFLASNYIYHVGPLFRQHLFMVMFETVAVVVLARVTDRADRKWPRRTMIAGLALLICAGYTKQLAAATVAAVFVFLFLRNPRRAVAWAVPFAGVAGAIFLFINVSTHGEWWTNIIAANVNTFMPQQALDLFRQWWRLHWALVIMAGLFALYELYFARLSLYTIWWAAAIADSALSGKWGAGDSYFATAIAATCILSGIFAARTLRGMWNPADNPISRRLRVLWNRAGTRTVWIRAAALIAVPALYVIYGLSVIHMPTEGRFFGSLSDALNLTSSYGDRYAFYDSAGWVPGYATIGHVPSQTDINNGWRIVDILCASDKPAMSEEAGFSLQADRDVITNPTQLKNLYENDLYDPTNLVNAIRAHDFSVLIFRAQFYPPPVLDAAYEAYYPSEVIVMNGFNYEIWRPGPSQPERDATAAALADLAPGEEITQPISLEPDAAATWITHMLSRQHWERSESAPAANCTAQHYTRDNETLAVEVCPAGDGAELTFGAVATPE